MVATSPVSFDGYALLHRVGAFMLKKAAQAKTGGAQALVVT